MPLEPSGFSDVHCFSALAPPHVSTLPPPSESYCGGTEIFKPFTAPEEGDRSTVCMPCSLMPHLLLELAGAHTDHMR